MKEFTFPLSFNDIEKLEFFNLTSYTVHPGAEVFDLTERDCINRLNAFKNALSKNWQVITHPAHFDLLYWLTKGFSESPEFKSSKVLQELCEAIYAMISELVQSCLKILDPNSIPSLRISFKMAMFLTFFFMSSTVTRKKAAQGDIVAEAMNKEANKRKKKQPQSDAFKILADRQKQILDEVCKSLSIDFAKLWQNYPVDDYFFNYYTNLGMKLFQGTIGREEPIRASIFEIFEIVLKNRPDIFKQLQFSLINLLYEEEVVDNLVHFFSKNESIEIQKLCTETMILAVACLNAKTNSTNAQSQAIKNTRDFLSKLSEELPRVFYTNLHCFINLYDSQSYILRNAITDILANIIRKVLSSNTGETEDMAKNKDKYFGILLQRIHDKNSHARSYILNVLAQLVSENKAPKNRLIHLLKAGVDRLRDVGVLTRKRAVILIYSVLKMYQYVYSKESQFKTTKALHDDIESLAAQERDYTMQLERLNEQTKSINDEQSLNVHLSDIKIVKKNLSECMTLQEFYRQYIQVIRTISEVTGTLGILLGSKNISDVVEVIKLFIFLKQLGIEGIENSLKKIYMLVFSKEKGVKEEVLHCFSILHITEKKPRDVANNLIQLFVDASLQDSTCLEEILDNLINEKTKKEEYQIDPEVFRVLWQNFVLSIKGNNHYQYRRASISILRVAFSADSHLLKSNYIASLEGVLAQFCDNGSIDYHTAREIAKIVQKCPDNVAASSKNFLVYLMKLLINDKTSNTQWYGLAEQSLTTIFTLCQYPEQYSDMLINELYRNLKNNNSHSGVARFIFILSHSCLKLLIHLDTLENKLKKLKIEAQKKNMGRNQQELEKAMGSIEGEFQRRIEQLQSLTDAIVKDPFVCKWLRIIQKIVENISEGSELERTAVLAFCKFMCISEKYCNANMKTLFSMLYKPEMDSVIKNNIIISMGDLLHRFPNLVQPHSQYLYQNLQDKDVSVRKTTMIVLTHLILNDMIKLKGEVCNIALLFQDQTLELQNLAKLFFAELNKKDPKFIYNMLPEAITKLSNSDEMNGARLTEKTFECFAKNIIGMLDKDKFSDVLIQKLCQRFKNTSNLIDLRNTAYCLNQLNLNEKSLRVFISNFQMIRPHMQDPDIANSIRGLANKMKKNSKPELKALIEELESKVSNGVQEVFDAEGVRRKNEKLIMKKKKEPKKKQPGRRAAGSRKRQTMEIEDDSVEIEQPSPGPNLRQRPTRNRGARNPVIIQSDMQSEDGQIEAYSQDV